MRAGIALLAAVLTLAPAPASARHLSRAEMEPLAWAGLHSICPGIPRRVVSFEVYRHGPYQVFEAMGMLPGSASVHPCMPFYFIDPATGDMWDGVSDCGEITSPAIRRMQARLRVRIGLSAVRYARIRRRGPMCDQG